MLGMMKALLAALVLIGAAFGGPLLAQPGPSAVARTPHVTAELAPETAGIAPGATVHVALRQTIKSGWHTYWRNPGDSGEATRIDWTLPEGWRAGEIVWPAPERQPIGPLVNYGYSGEVLLPVPITAPAHARPGEIARLTARAFWLVCEEICVPEEAVLSIALPVTAGAPAPHPRFGPAVSRTLATAPKPEGLRAAAALEGGALKLAALGAPLVGAESAYFFPFDGALIDHAAPQALERGPEGLTLTLAPGYALQAGGALSGPVQGVLVADDRAHEIAAGPGALPSGAAGLGPPKSDRPEGSSARLGGGLTLPLAIAFAFLGGLILNLMPCVFPVLSMKAAALAGHAHEPRAARAQGMAFLAGVLATFAALAAALLAARAAGQAAGWGFQLQSPPVVAALALVMFAAGLNLSGVFHAGGGMQNAGSNLASRGALAGAFFTGALAVVVAAPCTAPFMAGAIGYAMTQPAPAALAVFLALGLGLAAPFVAMSFSPALLGRLPRPGPWMDGLKQLLAFPMYAAAAWLAWVYSRQAGEVGLFGLLMGAVALALAAWLFGLRQRVPRRGVALDAAAAAVALAAAVPLIAMAWSGRGADARDPARQRAVAAASAGVRSEPFSPERLAALRAEGRPVFVNFTADWCVTCKLNERTALSSGRVAEVFADSGVAYLKADWTRRDAVIAAALAEHGRSGVPLYLLYPADGGAPVIMPQLLTEGGVAAALAEAARPPARVAAEAPGST